MNLGQLQDECNKMFEELKNIYGENYSKEASIMHYDYLEKYLEIYNNPNDNGKSRIKNLKYRYKKKINKLRKKYGLPLES